MKKYFILLLTLVLPDLAQASLDVGQAEDLPVLVQGRVMPAAYAAQLHGELLADLLREQPDSFKPIPLLHHGQNSWLTPADARAVATDDVEMNAALDAWDAIAVAVANGNQADLDVALAVHRQFIVRRVGTRPEIKRLPGEWARRQIHLRLWGGLQCVCLLCLA